MTEYPLISVIILNWNRLEDTKRAIDSILQQTYKNLEIIVIDNHSDEPGSETLPEIYPMIRFYPMEKNYGCPGGRNIGISSAKGEYLFFVDNDGILEANAISNAYAVFRENENVGIVAGRVIFFKDIKEVNKNMSPLKNKGYYASSFSGGIAMHKRSIYESIGMYNPDFMYGGEETNLSLRLLTANQYIYYSDQVILWHKRSESARPKQFNFISGCSNMYHTYMQLMPLEFRALFFIHFLFIYPVYAWKKGCFIPFLKSMPAIYRRKLLPLSKKIKLNREHVYLHKALSKGFCLNYKKVEQEKQGYSYWKYLQCLVSA